MSYNGDGERPVYEAGEEVNEADVPLLKRPWAVIDSEGLAVRDIMHDDFVQLPSGSE